MASYFKLATSSSEWGQCQHVSPLEISTLHVQIVSILVQVGDDDDMASIFIIQQVTQGEPM